MPFALSVNGELKSLTYAPGEDESRSTGYNPISIGKPLVVRYLNFFLKIPNTTSSGSGDDELWYRSGGDDNSSEEVMITTFVKTTEEKKGAAEVINYYNPEMLFKNGISSLDSFGGELYGHELCYYTKSYLGETVRLTTKIMELDDASVQLSEIADGIERIGSAPMFIEYLPYVATAKAATNIIGKLLKFLDRDDPIVKGISLDLFYNVPHAKKLQSGRIVCVDGLSEKELLSKYALSQNNILINKKTNEEYQTTSYYVLQVNSETNKLYDGFEYYQGAAELLSKVNRKGRIQDFVGIIKDSLETYYDRDMINEIEGLRFDVDDDSTKQKINALYKKLTPQMKELYKDRLKEILGT